MKDREGGRSCLCERKRPSMLGPCETFPWRYEVGSNSCGGLQLEQRFGLEIGIGPLLISVKPLEQVDL